MARNGSGTYVLPAGQPVVTGTTISSTTFNALTSDLANALTASIASDGQTTPTANLPMGGYKHTNVANGSARTDYVAFGQVQDAVADWLTGVAGTNIITASISTPTLTAYAAGQTFRFVSAGANTGAVTLNINSLGAKSVTKNGTTALVSGDIPNGAVITVIYDGTRFQLQTLTPVSAGIINFASGDQILFRGTTTPSGWTVVAQNNKALRIVSGTPSSGGSTVFTSVFGSSINTGSTTLTTNQIPSHTHGLIWGQSSGTAGAAQGSSIVAYTNYSTLSQDTQATGGGAGHTHTMPMDLAYYDMNLIQKT